MDFATVRWDVYATSKCMCNSRSKEHNLKQTGEVSQDITRGSNLGGREDAFPKEIMKYKSIWIMDNLHSKYLI